MTLLIVNFYASEINCPIVVAIAYPYIISARRLIEKLYAAWLSKLQNRLEELKREEEHDTVRLCFGSRKLFHVQFALEANGFACQRMPLSSGYNSASASLPPTPALITRP